ncbi:MAG: phosphate transport system protein [Thermoleophilaceae bacterium]|nr:phosphate transport system protein [Thermoleophilaceae bacterium]
METRHTFREQLAGLESQALGGLELASQALERTIEAVEQQDIELAALVIADDDRIDGRYLEVHQGILSLLARQAPVATDLRLVAALLHVIRHVERMGDQCVNICKLLPLEGHEPPRHEDLVVKIVQMGRQAVSQIKHARLAFAHRDVEMAEDLVRQDDVIDCLNREVFKVALDIGDDPEVREWAMHMVLVARALERVGDMTVDIGEHTAFVVTGLFREFQDASHPEVQPGAAPRTTP